MLDPEETLVAVQLAVLSEITDRHGDRITRPEAAALAAAITARIKPILADAAAARSHRFRVPEPSAN